MKRMLMILTIAFALSGISDLYASDEYKTNEVYAGYGEVSMLSVAVSVLDSIAYSYTSPFTGAKSESDNGSYGPFIGGYNYYINENFSLGGAGSYEILRTRWEYRDGYTDFDWTFASAMVKIQVTYGWEWVKFYQGLSLGATYAESSTSDSSGFSRSNDKIMPAGHFALLGIRVGKEFGIFADIGFGTLGLVNFGASYIF